MTTLAVVEFPLRWRYAEPVRGALPEVAAIQKQLVLHPELGFAWRPNISAAEGIVASYQDSVHVPLTTDAWGFIEAPGSIADRAAGKGIDVAGIGDSFIEHAADTFHDFFTARGLTYYNLAIHRQGPPQYTIALEKYAMPLKPKWIVYGIFENDFAETDDFYQWRESGLDWFTFHSGTWCGPSLSVGSAERFFETHARGYAGLFGALERRARGERMSVAGPTEKQIEEVIGSCAVAVEIVDGVDGVDEKGEGDRTYRTNGTDGADVADGADVRLMLVLVPSRATMGGGGTLEARAYDRIVAWAEGVKEIRLVDLRGVFGAQEDPGSLYYERDGHWNAKGMELAAEAIFGAMK